MISLTLRDGVLETAAGGDERQRVALAVVLMRKESAILVAPSKTGLGLRETVLNSELPVAG